MQHPRCIANAARIHGHIDDLLLHGRRLTSISIRQEKRAPVIWARTAPIPLLALPRHAMSYHIRAVTVGAVQYLKNHESTLSCWSFSASHPRIKDSRSTPLEHLRAEYRCGVHDDSPLLVLLGSMPRRSMSGPRSVEIIDRRYCIDFPWVVVCWIKLHRRR